MAEHKLPKAGWCGDMSRGAALGRSPQGEGQAPAGRLRLARVRLDSGGYDNGGAYWGHGQPLYRASGETKDFVFEQFVRADDRDDAKQQIREMFPREEVKFFR